MKHFGQFWSAGLNKREKRALLLGSNEDLLFNEDSSIGSVVYQHERW